MLDFFKLKKLSQLSVDRGTPITDIRFAVIDTELTGLNERKDGIISIGAVRMKGMRIDIGNTFHELIRPEKAFKAESVVIHQITPSDVVEKPSIDVVLADFLEFCGDDVLIGHCISIDLSFINREMKRIAGKTIQNPTIDTFRVYEWLRTRAGSRSCFSSPMKDSELYKIATCFGIPVQGAHDALFDAFITAQLFQRFLPVLSDVGVNCIGELLEIGNPEEGGDRVGPSSQITNF